MQSLRRHEAGWQQVFLVFAEELVGRPADWALVVKVVQALVLQVFLLVGFQRSRFSRVAPRREDLASPSLVVVLNQRVGALWLERVALPWSARWP